MKILYLTQVLPYPLDAGPKVRIYYALRYLTQFHQVTLVSFIRSPKELEYVEHLRSFCHSVHTVLMQRSRARDAFFMLQSMVTRQPFVIVRDHVQSMAETIQRLVAQDKFDVVHADQLEMAQYAVPLPHAKVLDAHNVLWTLVERLYQNANPGLIKWLLNMEWQKLQTYEAHTCSHFDQILTVTEEDKAILQSLGNNAMPSITVIPICIDPSGLSQIARNGDAHNIICVGGMFYMPNVEGVVWFANHVFPIIESKYPMTKFVVVGARPDPSILKIAERDSRICVTGYVPDTQTHLRSSAVFIVPLHAGGGMRVKILDAWARGIPVVSTTIGCEGIETLPGQNILIADTPHDFANAIMRILDNPTFGKYLADNGRQWVEHKYDWRMTYQKFDMVYSAACQHQN